jgi:hypothetical protein
MATPKEIQAALIGYPRQLRWEDFRTVDELPDSTRPEHDAGVKMDFRITHYGILYQGGKALYKPQVTVTLMDAWATARARTDKALLKHEQGHFEIMGLLARDLAATLLDLELDNKKVNEVMLAPAANPAEAEAKMQRFVNMWKAAMKKAEEKAWALSAKLNNTPGSEGLYDLDTSHGLDRDFQRDWDALLLHVKMHNLNFEQALIKRGWLYDPRPADPVIPARVPGSVR